MHRRSWASDHYQHPESKYKSDNTASNKAGVTLMNNQIGAVVAQVMARRTTSR